MPEQGIEDDTDPARQWVSIGIRVEGLPVRSYSITSVQTSDDGLSNSSPFAAGPDRTGFEAAK